MNMDVKQEQISADKNYLNRKPQRDYISYAEFTSDVPSIPFPQKFIRKKMNLKKFIEYSSSFDQKHKSQILLGLEAQPQENYIPKELLLNKKAMQDIKRSQLHAVKLSFIPQFHSRRNKDAKTRITTIKKEIVDTHEYHPNPKRQIKIIEKTFQKAKNKCTEHPKKKGVFAEEESFILPDFKYFGATLVPIDFLDYPELPNVPDMLKEQTLLFSQMKRIIDGYGHFIPTIDSIGKQLEAMELESDDEENIGKKYEYELDREYSFVRLPTHKEYYLRITPEGTFYAPLAKEKEILKPLRRLGKKITLKMNLTVREQNAKETKECNSNMDRLLKRSEREAIEMLNRVEQSKSNEYFTKENTPLPVKTAVSKKKKSKRIEIVEPDDLFSSDESTDESSSDEYQPPSDESLGTKKNLSDLAKIKVEIDSD